MRGKTYKLLGPAQLVRIVFDRSESGTHLAAYFECIPCSDMSPASLVWLSTDQVWLCPGCEHELHPDEATWVVRRCKEGLKALETDISNKRGSSWALVRWFKTRWSGKGR